MSDETSTPDLTKAYESGAVEKRWYSRTERDVVDYYKGLVSKNKGRRPAALEPFP